MKEIVVQMKKNTVGFTLVEMAVVLTIVTVLMAGLLPLLSSQMELKKINETRGQMEEIRASLLGFSTAYGRLPCPDTDTPRDGMENIAAPTITNDYPQTGQSTKTYSCSANEGGLPYNQLGVKPQDPYNNNYLYRVKSQFAERNEVYSSTGGTGTLLTTTFFTLNTTGNLRVCNTAACSIPRLIDNAAAVLVSSGKNWANPPSPDETENTNNNNDFVSRDFAADFDDLVVWISPNILFSRMIAAGKLP